jgi:hypothetical protein
MEQHGSERLLLERHVKKESLIRHCLATGAAMKKVAGALGQDEDLYEAIGILHDIDYEGVDGDEGVAWQRR